MVFRGRGGAVRGAANFCHRQRHIADESGRHAWIYFILCCKDPGKLDGGRACLLARRQKAKDTVSQARRRQGLPPGRLHFFSRVDDLLHRVEGKNGQVILEAGRAVAGSVF